MLLRMSMSGDAHLSKRRPRIALASALLLCGTVAATAVEVADPAGALSSPPLVRVTFDDMGSSAAAATPASSGSLQVTTTVLTSGGATLGVAADSSGSTTGHAAQFPGYDTTTPYQRAAVSVVSSSGDPLSPGDADFEFGADFALDTPNQGISADNGNNLVQRGFFNEPAQYKLQLDGGHVSCRVRGAAGATTVKSRLAVTAGRWYSASCARTGSTVTLRVQAKDGSTGQTITVSQATGSVQMASAAIPLTIGGKVNASGHLVVNNSDQFNGRVDNVYFGY
jgi:hypothetical protein